LAGFEVTLYGRFWVSPEERPPILARRFHGDLRDLAVLQPGPQLFEIARKGAKLPLLGLDVPLSRGSQHAHHHAVLVYVNAAAAAQVLFHKCSFDRRAKDAWDDEKTFLRVFIHRKVETTVPGSSDCVLTRFKLGLESTNR
jgi:hypothetical protein